MQPCEDLKNRLKERLELCRAILTQLRDTRLFNSMVDQGIEDIDWLIKKGGEE